MFYICSINIWKERVVDFRLSSVLQSAKKEILVAPQTQLKKNIIQRKPHMDQTYLAYSSMRLFVSSEVNAAKIVLIFSTGKKHTV